MGEGFYVHDDHKEQHGSESDLRRRVVRSCGVRRSGGDWELRVRACQPGSSERGDEDEGRDDSRQHRNLGEERRVGGGCKGSGNEEGGEDSLPTGRREKAGRSSDCGADHFRRRPADVSSGEHDEAPRRSEDGRYDAGDEFRGGTLCSNR